MRLMIYSGVHFNPRPPRGGRQQGRLTMRVLYRISIHALHGEGDCSRLCASAKQPISIHALHGEGDLRFGIFHSSIIYFNPRPPRGGRLPHGFSAVRGDEFQSTPSTGRATASLISSLGGDTDFNPRPPRGGRRPTCQQTVPAARHFNPRPPRGGRHAFHLGLLRRGKHFNPRPPRGGRQTSEYASSEAVLFQSTPSTGRATVSFQPCRCSSLNFNPRPPRGGRHNH